MSAIYSNLQSGTLTDNPFLIGATTMNSAAFANLPTVTTPDFMWVVLDPTSVAGAPEIVKVTAHSAASTTVTIARAQQSTVARQHLLATIWRHVSTKEDLDGLPHRILTTTGDTMYASAANTPARVAKGVFGQTFRQNAALTAPEWGNGYLSGLAASRPAPSAPLDGVLFYATDTGTVSMCNGTTWSTIGPVDGGRTVWTPTIFQGIVPSSTSTDSTYMRIGRQVIGSFIVTMGAVPGNAGAVITVTLPVAPKGSSVNYFLGRGKLYDANTGFEYIADLVLDSATAMKFQIPVNGGALTFLGTSSFTAALANSDVLAGSFQYEAAADA